MIANRLIRKIQESSSRLTADLVQALLVDPRTQAYRSIPRDRLIEIKTENFDNLGRWLSERSKFALEQRFRKLGRERYLGGIPLSEVLFALKLEKRMMVEFMRRAVSGDAHDLPLEHELCMSVSEFFDEAMYFAALGYEDAYHAGMAIERGKPERERKYVQPLVSQVAEKAIAASMDMELPISRAGEIGEASG